MAVLESLETDEQVTAFVAEGMPPPAGWVGSCNAGGDEEPMAGLSRATPPSADKDIALRHSFGKHGKWKSCGEYGWCKASIEGRASQRLICAE